MGSYNPLKLRRMFIIAFLDALGIAFSGFLALWLRFEFRFNDIDPLFLETYPKVLLFWIPISIIVLSVFRLYDSVWSFVGVDELNKCCIAYVMLGLLLYPCVKISGVLMPRSFYIMGLVFSFLCTVGIRFMYRAFRMLLRWSDGNRTRSSADRIMIIGAGQAGRMLIREYASSLRTKGNVICAIDDSVRKQGTTVEGVRIVGTREDIPAMVIRYHITKIVFAIPAASSETRKAILNICSTTGCSLQAVPGIYQLANGEVKLSQLRDVNIQDLLGRDQIQVNLDEIFRSIGGKVIMVTGGGGSIGSELCRQIAASHPKQLIVFDIYENNAYDLQMELIHRYPELDLKVLIGSVRNKARVDSILETYHPEIIFHAAAHKHVPLMENSPNEAIKNNVLGTYKTALSAAEHGVRKFVLISTDKAVNPTNIMGASKRMCEMVVQMMNRETDTDFVAVRFGNVLGSSGSVVPLFRKQIAEGGPVTVTHPDIIRYFMTIPEAVSLVLQAGYYAKGGEIFVLDMGKPVRIDDMARNMIRLSGYEPDVDIKIVYTGLRPGEKLYEELLMSAEGLRKTDNDLIFIGKDIEMDDAQLKQNLKLLDEASAAESDHIKELMAQVVPTYTPDLEHS